MPPAQRGPRSAGGWQIRRATGWYDTGPLIAAERNDRRMWALHAGFLHSRHADVVDVTVVEGAIRRGDAVVTSNRDHIEQVGQAAGVTLRVEDV